MKKYRLSSILTAIIGLLVVISLVASCYFFYVAQVRSEKAFISEGGVSASSPIYEDQQHFLSLDKELLTMENGGLEQVAWYAEAEKETNKTVIVVHGFSGNKEKMAPYANVFHELGYNVLVPDHIAAGESEGNIIGYGWNDRLNVIKWAEVLLEQNPSSEIVLFGLSMGGATVMMASGEESLPEQVYAIIEDCGYSSVWEELEYQAGEMYHLPAFPILYEVSMISKLVAGFSYGEASSLQQLEKNTRPILFIHGDQDTFVPTDMVYQNYGATKAEKELYLVEGADHADALETDRENYIARVKAFLEKYED